jgi:DNA processing protein
MKINSISPDDTRFLQRLKNIAKMPKSLRYIGTIPTDYPLVVSIVGTRRPTAYGRTVTEQIASSLAGKGVVVVSGMALGVDAIAHTAALDAGGQTVAILPSGLDDPYPKTNHQLARRILQSGGALITEYVEGHKPRLYDFLARNRLVSGVADAVIVTEANIRSGTLSTVAHALEQGTSVYAVPGPITSPLSAGCNALIAQGATPITSVDALLDQLGLTSSVQMHLGDTDEEMAILTVLRQGLHDGEDIQNSTGYPVELVSQTLTMLEIKGYVHALGGNKWRL